MDTKAPELDDLFQSIGQDRVYADSMDDASRRALAGEILVALIRSGFAKEYKAGVRHYSLVDLAGVSLQTAAIIYPLAPTAVQFSDLAPEQQVDLAAQVPPPTAAREGIDAVAPAHDPEAFLRRPAWERS